MQYSCSTAGLQLAPEGTEHSSPAAVNQLLTTSAFHSTDSAPPVSNSSIIRPHHMPVVSVSLAYLSRINLGQAESPSKMLLGFTGGSKH